MKELSIEAAFIKKNWFFSFPEKVYCRASPSSDFSVFLQVFYHEQYQNIISIAQLNGIEIKYILDLGANVGYTSIYFHRYFPNAKILAVEPDTDNFNQLKLHINDFKNIIPANYAVWSYQTMLNLKNVTSDSWGKSYDENIGDNGNIEAHNILNLQNKYQFPNIDILKMDIEGAEKAIFDHGTEFLDTTKLIAIEIHDDCADRNKINQNLKKHGFTIWELGELTIGINKNLIPK
jgi:FkbM family methyltransferase